MGDKINMSGKEGKYNIYVILILVLAVIVRIAFLGVYPKGIDVDEAYGGYEAWSLANYGFDSWGYNNPVYLETWGSGMSVMYSLVSIPFVKMMGLNSLSVRMAQALFGILTVVVIYLLLRKIATDKIAIWGCALLAISPWHIIMSRYGLDANLVPAFILFAMYFGVLAIENNSKPVFMILSAVFWGLSLYCYALIWYFVPLFLALSTVYCLKYRKLKISWLICFWIIVGILALPLLLFLAVNKGIIGEIKTPFISIPKIAFFRASKLSIKNIIPNIRALIRIFVKQNDDRLRDVIPYFGINYLFSLPLAVYGGCIMTKNVIRNAQNKKFGYEIFLFWWIIVSVFIGVISPMNIQRINFLHLAGYILIAIGICHLVDLLGTKLERFILIIYACSFIMFAGYYFTKYQDEIGELQLSGTKEALEYAVECVNEGTGGEIHIIGTISHSQVLFYTEYPTDEFMEEVEWKNYPDVWVRADKFGVFHWDDSVEENDNYIYIVTKDRLEEFEQKDYTIKIFDNCAVVY
jgi:4-amino-4-deoxy-L-arabinose transferase-like glycosyltransferase